MSAVTLIFAEGSVVLAAVGVEAGLVPLEVSYCVHVVEERDWVGISNSLDDPRVCDKKSTIEGGFRSYLGVPLITPSGKIIGALCVADYQVRHWQPTDVQLMHQLAQRLMATVVQRESPHPGLQGG